MYSRPKASETDEDILRLQKEFKGYQAENKIKLSATVVSSKKDVDDETSDVLPPDIEDQLANTFEAIPEFSKIGAIIEKTEFTSQPAPFQFSNTTGFPKPKRRSIQNPTTSGGSIFAQQFKKLKPNSECTSQYQPPSTSFVISGADKDRIHKENLWKLNSMTQKEIHEEREHLLTTMDPAIVAFLKSRRQKMQIVEENRHPSIKEQNTMTIDAETIETPVEIINQSEKWLNFDVVEASKLAWMKDVDNPKIEKGQSYEARFDFEGWLMPYTDEIKEKTRALYHHGHEPGRPGYTLQELFQLCRSTVIQQKIVALSTIANILQLEATGVYDTIIELPIEQIFFVLRFCLDDNVPGVVNAAIKAVRNLFYSKIDETCLDSLHGFGFGRVQPILAVDESTEDDNTVNDQQLAETNLVKCLHRTGILTRIRYIINTIRPATETIVYCLDILTRLVRDSNFILTSVVKTESLIESITTNFVPSTMNQSEGSESPYGAPLLQALKFIRILSSRKKEIAMDLIAKYHIMDAVSLYLSNEVFSRNVNGLRLQVESMHLWSVFLHYNTTQEYISVLTPVLMELLRYHYNHTNVDAVTTYIRQSHVAALVTLISTCVNSSGTFGHFSEIMRNCTVKWLKQFMNVRECNCGRLQIVSSLFHFWAIMCQGRHTSQGINSILMEVLRSEAFHINTNTLRNGSMLLNNYETHKTSANLRSLEVAAWYCSEHIIPVIQTNSPIPFISALSYFIEANEDQQIKLAFLQCENIVSYLNALRNLDRYHLSTNWFTKVESSLIMNILKISVQVKSLLETRCFFEVAIKCLSIFTPEQKKDLEYVFSSIIFNPGFYPSEVLLKNLSIQDELICFETSLSNLDEILQVYLQVLGLLTDIPTFEDTLCLDNKEGNVIPIDWIYTPIIVLYSNQENTTKDEAQLMFTIRNCLRWVLIYETYFPELALQLNATDRFCRLACVFLGSDSLFLIEEIQNLLKLCLNNLMKNEKEINFNKTIEGLNSFQDFYTQLLEQYQGVSYGNKLFGNFILVPLAQRHSDKWRKTLWSEYYGVVEVFNVAISESVCPMELFINEVESDMSILRCYRRALGDNCVRKHSILYHIAKHHVEQFIKNKRKSNSS